MTPMTPSTPSTPPTPISPRSTPPPIGQFLGPYRIDGLLGEGAMGAVFLATDTTLRRQVALKVIHAHLLADEIYLERFLREAQAAARLASEHIVQIYAAGRENGSAYLALELVRGGSLGDLARRQGGRLSPRLVVEIALGAARGLAAAHAQGIIHRDIKPDNILLAEGRAKLSDFGIARIAAGSQRITRSGFFVGTPRYSSPEQCNAEEVDGRSDLFSLGVVLYELLAGALPHQADTPLALLRQICQEPPRPLREYRPEAPQALAEVIHRLLAKAPADRPPQAEMLADELETLLAAMPVDGPTLRELTRSTPAPTPAATPAPTPDIVSTVPLSTPTPRRAITPFAAAATTPAPSMAPVLAPAPQPVSGPMPTPPFARAKGPIRSPRRLAAAGAWSALLLLTLAAFEILGLLP